MVFEPSLAAGRDTARGECLWAGWLQAPGGHVPSEVDWFTRLSPQSCFDERPSSLSAPGLCVGTKERKLVDRELSSLCSRAHMLQVWNSHQTCRCSQGAYILWDLFRPSSRTPVNAQPSDYARHQAHGARTAAIERHSSTAKVGSGLNSAAEGPAPAAPAMQRRTVLSGFLASH